MFDGSIDPNGDSSWRHGMSGASEAPSQEINEFTFDPFRLHFGRDKLVIIDRRAEDGRHLTIHFCGRSGMVDAHVTEPAAARVHRTLGGVPRSELESLLAAIGLQAERHIFQLVKRILRPVRFGWLEHMASSRFRPRYTIPVDSLTSARVRGSVGSRGRRSV